MKVSAATHCMIYVTATSRDEAHDIGHTLVEEKLVACVNILDNATSIYRWNGKVHEEKEVIILLKTRRELSQMAIERIKSLHSNGTPCAVVYDMALGLKDFLEWIDKNTLSTLENSITS